MFKKIRRWINKHLRRIKVYNLIHEPRNLDLEEVELTGDEIILILDTEDSGIRMSSWKGEPNLNLTDLSQTRKEMRAPHHPRSTIRKRRLSTIPEENTYEGPFNISAESTSEG